MADLEAMSVKKTVEAGAGNGFLTGGKPLDRSWEFLCPTVLTNIPKARRRTRRNCSARWRAVFRAADGDDAIRRQRSPLRIRASAWTNDKNEREAHQRSGIGMVFITAWWLRIRECSCGREMVGARG